MQMHKRIESREPYKIQARELGDGWSYLLLKQAAPGYYEAKHAGYKFESKAEAIEAAQRIAAERGFDHA